MATITPTAFALWSLEHKMARRKHKKHSSGRKVGHYKVPTTFSKYDRKSKKR